jgi:hypothetical protein
VNRAQIEAKGGFREFYAFYLGEHANRTCRRLHFVGTSLVLVILTVAVATGQWRWLWGMPVVGYGFAWVGHFGFEKNRPATFQRPLFSLAGDWVMFWQMLTGRIRF